MNVLHKWRAFFLVAAMLLASSVAVAGIADTKHNLSASGTGTYKATAETQICVYCHAPHNANPSAPLWNHTLSGAIYQPYSSNTMKAAAPGQPTGGSKLCLTCHDGTVALGSAVNVPGTHFQPGVIAGLAATLLGTSANVGTDLRNDHPVSFTYDSALAAGNTELVNPTTLTGKIKPGADGQMQCTNCHDPHSSVNPKFMLTGYQDGAGYGSPLCRTCHNKEYYSTVPNMGHRESIAQWNGVAPNPWYIPGQNLANNPNSTVKANGCENCHQPHNSASSKQLLKSGGGSATCLNCHNGNVAAAPDRAMAPAFAKMYKHPLDTGKHNPKRMADGKIREDVADLSGSNRHADCEDCHNPHAVSPGGSPNPPATTSPLTPKVNKGVWGVAPAWPTAWADVTTYTTKQDTTYQYEICLKCHSYYAYGAFPPADPYGGHIANNVTTDQAKEFNPNNKSFHPVAAVGKNPLRMGSYVGAGGNWVEGTGASFAQYALTNGMTRTSQITCTECHSDPASALGAAPKGPHGSDIWPILWAPYTMYTGQPGTQDHLCFKCHPASTYGADGIDDNAGTGYQTGFSAGDKNFHVKHVIMRNQPCQSCHSAVPHGWKRRSMLIVGRGPGGTEGDPRPYNSHNVFYPNPNGGNGTAYGIPYNVDGVVNWDSFDTVPSGNWQRSDCHSGDSTGVGC